MEDKRYPLSEQFKGLWDETSKMKAEWDKFEVIHWAHCYLRSRVNPPIAGKRTH